MSYYNTTSESGQQLIEYVEETKKQQALILSYFDSKRGQLLTPFDVYNALFSDTKVPITSVRRTMTDLTGMGLIQKTDIKKKAETGRSNYCWIKK
jgi:Fe2+ or Zn2+ uptake regulation protein